MVNRDRNHSLKGSRRGTLVGYQVEFGHRKECNTRLSLQSIAVASLQGVRNGVYWIRSASPSLELQVDFSLSAVSAVLIELLLKASGVQSVLHISLYMAHAVVSKKQGTDHCNKLVLIAGAFTYVIHRAASVSWNQQGSILLQ